MFSTEKCKKPSRPPTLALPHFRAAPIREKRTPALIYYCTTISHKKIVFRRCLPSTLPIKIEFSGAIKDAATSKCLLCINLVFTRTSFLLSFLKLNKYFIQYKLLAGTSFPYGLTKLVKPRRSSRIQGGYKTKT